jgi:hypothetical protein
MPYPRFSSTASDEGARSAPEDGLVALVAHAPNGRFLAVFRPFFGLFRRRRRCRALALARTDVGPGSYRVFHSPPTRPTRLVSAEFGSPRPLGAPPARLVRAEAAPPPCTLAGAEVGSASTFRPPRQRPAPIALNSPTAGRAACRAIVPLRPGRQGGRDPLRIARRAGGRRGARAPPSSRPVAVRRRAQWASQGVLGRRLFRFVHIRFESHGPRHALRAARSRSGGRLRAGGSRGRGGVAKARKGPKAAARGASVQPAALTLNTTPPNASSSPGFST